MSLLSKSRELLAEANAVAEEKKKESRPEKKTPSRSTSSRSSRPAPQNVEPGWIHYKIATAILAKVASSVQQTLVKETSPGEYVVPQIDVGFTPEVVEVVEEKEAMEPVEVLARIIAHIFHRLPVLKKFEKKFEGREKKSGLGSDVAKLLFQLWKRNQHLGPIVWAEVRTELARQKAAQKGGSRNGKTEVVPTATDADGE